MAIALVFATAACNLSDPLADDESGNSDVSAETAPIDSRSDTAKLDSSQPRDGEARDTTRPPTDGDVDEPRDSAPRDSAPRDSTPRDSLDVPPGDTHDSGPEAGDSSDLPFTTDVPADCDGSGEICNGVDDDCDGTIDESCPCDYANKSVGVCKGSTITATGGCKKPAAYESTEQTCDNRDNDCDGSVDEECNQDTDQYCTETMTVSGSPSVCPSGGGDCDDSKGSVHPGVTEACADQIDNDCDGDTDCADGECAGASCSSSGGASCQSGTCVETNCSDGVDNDGDGQGDCLDTDCTGSGCGESACGDGIDNDSDGDTDCADADCAGLSCNGTGTACDSASGSCEETDCSDGTDNDGDGDADQCDSDCGPNPCGTGTTCVSGGTCIESDCTNGIDDDNDGQQDCLDSNCSCPTGQTCCHPGGSTPRCKSSC